MDYAAMRRSAGFAEYSALAEDLEAGRRLQGREEDVRHLGAAAAPAPRQADGEGDAGLQVGDVGQRAVALQQQ